MTNQVLPRRRSPDQRRGFTKTKRLTPRAARIAVSMRKHRASWEVAKELGISPQNVTVTIRLVEYLVGVRLFARHKGNRTPWDLLETPATTAAWERITREAA